MNGIDKKPTRCCCDSCLYPVDGTHGYKNAHGRIVLTDGSACCGCPKVQHGTSISSVAERCYRINKENGWHTPEMDSREFGTILMLVTSELVEALEHSRCGHTVKEVFTTKDSKGNDKPDGIPYELADAVIRVLDYCYANDIDIETAIYDKLEYNKTREWQHGKKKV